MKHLGISTIALLLFSLTASAQSGWKDMQGNPVPETSFSKSRGGFSAALIVTPDKDWLEKWNTPPETVPNFTTATEVSAGGELFILTFLSNPMLDKSDMADVACDFVVVRPDGTTRLISWICLASRPSSRPTQRAFTSHQRR